MEQRVLTSWKLKAWVQILLSCLQVQFESAGAVIHITERNSGLENSIKLIQ